MSDGDANDYDKLKKPILTKYNFTEDCYKKRFREVKTEETPDQFVIRLKNYLAKWLELSRSSFYLLFYLFKKTLKGCLFGRVPIFHSAR